MNPVRPVFWTVAAALGFCLALLPAEADSGFLSKPGGDSALATSSWTLALGGDVMLNGVSPSRDPFLAVGALLRGADLTVVNLEIPLTQAATRTTRKSAEAIARRQQYVLKAHPEHAKWLAKAGIDAVTLGNNHALDFGLKGLDEMRDLLREQGIRWCGAGDNRAKASAPALLTIPGGKLAVLSFLAFRTKGGLWACTPAGPSTSGVAVLDFGGTIDSSARTRIGAIVSGARKSAGFVLVALHWGDERQPVPTAYQVALGRAFVDAGADAVVGHHPHVLQGAELYRGKPILYSLGNLVSSRPGETAIAKLSFSGSSLAGAFAAPCRISGGAVSPHSGRAASAGLDRFRELGKRLLARYPNPNSEPLAWTLWSAKGAVGRNSSRASPN